MAEIFVARQWGDGGFERDVVIKRLHPHLAERRRLLEEFCREGQWMARIDHPGLPAIHDLRHEDGQWYCVMERLRGITLGAASRMEREMGRTMRWEVVFSVALQLCDILQSVHEQVDDAGRNVGLIHGDLGPENIFLGRDGRVRLIDFGICTDALQRRDLKGTDGGIRGTVGYIAPETIATIQTADRRADLHVVGVLLYELTTGERIHPGDGMAYVNAVLAGPPQAPSTRTEADYPPALEAVVLRCLQREPSKRFSDTRTLGAALANIAKTLDLRTGADVLAGYIRALAPAAEEAPSPQTVPPPFVVATEEVLEPEPVDESVLSAEEHDELLADLEMFSVPAPAPVASSDAPAPDAGLDELGRAPAFRSPRGRAASFDDATFDEPFHRSVPPPFDAPSQTQTRARRRLEGTDVDEFVIALNDDD